MSTARRIGALVGGVSLLLLLVGVAGAWYVRQVERHSSELLETNVASMRAVEELQLSVSEIRYRLGHFLVDADKNDLPQAARIREDAERRLARIKSLSGAPEEQVLVQKIGDGLLRLFTDLEQVAVTTERTAQNEQVRRLVNEALTNSILPPVHQLVQFNEQELEFSSRKIRESADRTVFVLLFIGILGSIVGILAGYATARALNRSILRLSLPVRDVAGKLSHVADTISISADPGLDDLHVTLNKVSQHVGSVINQLHDRQRELLKADQLAAIGQLAAGLAHELRNPLMCMTVLVQSAISDRSRKLDDQDMQVLNDEMSRLDRLLQEFLDFARPRRIQPQAVDLGASVKQTLSVLIPKAERVSVEIEAKIPDEPVFAFADPDQLRQLTLNLVLNSIHAISRDGRVEVSVIANDEASGFCALEIVDTGPGLTDEQMVRLFEPFFSTKDFGLGMGLPICQRIVEAHGGEIFAGNGRLGGAVFKVRLPVAQQMDAAEAYVESAAAPPALTGDRG